MEPRIEDAFDDYSGNVGCGIPYRHDVVYRFTAPDAGRYRFTALDGVVSLGAGPCGGACSPATVSSSLDLAAGESISAILEGVGHTAGFREPGMLRLGTTVGGEPNACGDGPQVYVSFTSADGGLFLASTAPAFPGASSDARPFLADGTCDAGACPAIGFGQAVFRSVPGVPQYIGIQSTDGVGQDFLVLVDRLNPLAGDSCEAPLSLRPGLESVDTNLSLDDYLGAGGCGLPGRADLVYRFLPTRSGRYALHSELFLSVGQPPCGVSCPLRGHDVEVDVSASVGVYVIVDGLAPAPGPGNHGLLTVEFLSRTGADGGLVPDSPDASGGGSGGTPGTGGGTGTGGGPGVASCGCSSEGGPGAPMLLLATMTGLRWRLRRRRGPAA